MSLRIFNPVNIHTSSTFIQKMYVFSFIIPFEKLFVIFMQEIKKIKRVYYVNDLL